MTSLSAVVSITVVLLGGPQGLGPFTAERPYGGLAAPYGYGLPLQGDKIMYDAAAGLTTILTTILGPDEAAIRGLFQENGGSKAAIIEPTIEGGLYTWPESQFEFLWPNDRPQYYLEKLPGLYRGYTVYGRIELVDKEGYTVLVQPTGQPDELTVQVEFANKILSGGKYDETIRAFVGRPTLIKAVVAATAPLTKGQKTLLVWQPPSPPEMMGPGGMYGGMPLPGMMTGGRPMPPGGMYGGIMQAPTPSAGPFWAVGDWEVRILEEDESFTMTVHPDYSITIEADETGVAGSGSIEPSGRVQFRAAEEAAGLTGTLSPSGTGSGMIQEDDRKATWTATRLRAAETAQAAPFWAVGDWEVRIPGEDDRRVMIVHPDGTITINAVPGSGSVQPSGQMEFRVAGDNNEVLTGTLSPSGTGSGMIQEGDRKATWTATRVGGPDLAALEEQYLAAFEEQRKLLEELVRDGRAPLSVLGIPAQEQRKLLEELVRDGRAPLSVLPIPAQSAPTLRVLDSGRHPTGVAVLLEVTATRED